MEKLEEKESRDYMTTDNIEFIRNVLSLGNGFNEYGSLWDSVWWRTDDKYFPVTFFVNCNDTFALSCADCEKITPENFQLLIDSVADVRKVFNVKDSGRYTKDDFDIEKFNKWYDSGGYGSLLWCCRVRKERPIEYCYTKIPEILHPLFDAAGPPR